MVPWAYQKKLAGYAPEHSERKDILVFENPFLDPLDTFLSSLNIYTPSWYFLGSRKFIFRKQFDKFQGPKIFFSRCSLSDVLSDPLLNAIMSQRFNLVLWLIAGQCGVSSVVVPNPQILTSVVMYLN